MATHSSSLAWKIPWTEEPCRLQSMGSQRVGHNWETSLYFFTFMHWRRKWQPTPAFLTGESQGRGSLVGCRLWIAQGRTRLKRLSSSSSSSKDYLFKVHWIYTTHLATKWISLAWKQYISVDSQARTSCCSHIFRTQTPEKKKSLRQKVCTYSQIVHLLLCLKDTDLTILIVKYKW